MDEVLIRPLDVRRYRRVLTPEEWEDFSRESAPVVRALRGRTLWSISSTAVGGGVAEMLKTLLGYWRGQGIDARWLVIRGDAGFFAVTKRLHNFIHGYPGDGGALDEAAREAFERVARENASGVLRRVRREDVAVVHDPQPAPLIGLLGRACAATVWRCHIGTERSNGLTRAGWEFLRRYIEPADASVYSCSHYVPAFVPAGRYATIAPSLDAFSPKNQELSEETVRAILAAAGITASGAGGARPVFLREDGSEAEVRSRADTLGTPPVPEGGPPLVTQVSRWDRLKDPSGVLMGFSRHVAPHGEAHLVLAGPAVEAVSDDPEGAEVLAAVRRAWDGLPAAQRARVTLLCLPMRDVEENGAMVNALQRRSTVIVQKSLEEGFGLTVAEALWKGRPVVASRVGGILHQIEEGEDGLLINDPSDLRAFGGAVLRLLGDAPLRERLGQAARRCARRRFLHTRHLLDYGRLFRRLLSRKVPA